MINFLALIFLGMFVYGVTVGPLGAGLIALVMCVFTVWAGKQLRKRDVEYYIHPRSAQAAQRATSDVLDDHCSECTRSKF